MDDVADPPELLAAVDAALWLARVLERTPAPLTTAQFRIMRRAAAGGERSARLAEHLAVRKPTLTAIVDGLVAAGFLLRQADASDRRVIRLEVTAEGGRALADTERIFAGRFGELLQDASRPRDLSELLADLDAHRVARLIGANRTEAGTR